MRGNRGTRPSWAPLLRRVVLLATLAAALGACSTWDRWMGKGEKEKLPGKRISVLLQASQLTPDPKLAETDILLPAPVANPDWPQAGGYANHAMQHLDAGTALKRAWTGDGGTGASSGRRITAMPIVADGRVFIMDATADVTAFNAADGKHLWEADLTPDDEDDDHIGGGLAYEDGRVFVTTGFAEVIALDAKTGAVAWRKPVNSPMHTPPTVRGGRVFALTVDNHLYALNAHTGEMLWDFAGIAETASLLGGASPAVDGGVVVAAFSSGELLAFRVENGHVLWEDSLASVRRTTVASTLSQIRGRPVIDRDRVIAASYGGLTVAIDLRSGRRIWERDIGSMESPWVAGNYIFMLTNDGEIVCLSREQGRIYWVRALPRYEDEKNKEDPITWTGPVLVKDRLLVAGSNGVAMAVSPYTGRVLGNEKLPDGVSVPPVVANRTVYFMSDDADVLAYR